jgi:uridine kinase
MLFFFSVTTQLHTCSQRGFKVREKLLANECHEEQPLPTHVHVLPTTRQIIGMHTYIRSRETSRDEFIFYSQRLMRLLMEYALTFLPHKPVSVETADGHSYDGIALAKNNICGVSIVRAGETMEQALTDVLKVR